MAFGVLTTGFALKRFEDIKLEIEANLRASFGEIDTDADSVFGQLIGVFSRALAEVWEQSENIYNSMYPSTAEGLSLDNACSLIGISRLAAISSTCLVELVGNNGTVVNSGTTVSQSILGKVFETLEDITIDGSVTHKCNIEITSVDNFSYIITINGNTVTYVSGVGDSIQTIAENLGVLINTDPLYNTDVIAAFTVGDTFMTVTTLSYLLEDAFAISTSANLVLDEINVPTNVSALEAGAIPVPIDSIDTIASPIYGLDSVYNLVEGVTGRNVETDAELRIRRRNSLNIIAAGTLSSIIARIIQDIPEVSSAFIFENATDVVDAFGRPPHSFEVVVEAVDTAPLNLEIAQKIFERKPAGIQTFGTTSVSILDSNNDVQIINFSHSTTKYIHIKLECSTTGSDKVFPINGSDLIKTEILRLSEAFGFGSDILVQVFAAAGYIAGGVTSVICSVAATNAPGDSPSWQTTNLSILPSQFPSFDISRLTVVVS